MSPEELTRVTNNLGVDPAFLRRIVDEPMLVCEDQSNLVVSNLRALMADPEFKTMTDPSMRRETDDEFWGLSGRRAEYRPYDVENGTLIIPVKGTLIHRFGYSVGNNATGYEYIRRAFDRGMEDPDVKAIMFEINSPGGQAAGNFELVDHIVSFRGQKPFRAHAGDLALSGGYSIATVADPGQLSVTNSGHTGSVGVVVMHTNLSGLLEKVGVEISFIKAGERKTDGNPFEPLSDGARTRIQGGVDKFYARFVSTVANNRGMSDDAVRKTEADVFDAEESIEVGFADRIGDMETEMAEMMAVPRGLNMTKDNDTPAIDAAQIARDARAEERKRGADVRASEHFAGREDLANHLLDNTDMDAVAITATLAKSPKVEPAPIPDPETVPAAKRNHFDEAMAREGTPNVGDDAAAGEGSQENDPEANSAKILAAYRRSGGHTVSHSKH